MPSTYVKKFPNGRSQTVVCEVCGKPFKVFNRSLARGGGKFCSLECKYASEKNTQEIRCETCGKTVSIRPSEVKKGWRFCSWECRVIGIRGSGNVNWTNSPNNRGWDWKLIRLSAMERDGYRCTKCGKTDGLVVHHIVPWEQTQDNSLDNLMTLCVSCHMHIHKSRSASS